MLPFLCAHSPTHLHSGRISIVGPYSNTCSAYENGHRLHRLHTAFCAIHLSTQRRLRYVDLTTLLRSEVKLLATHSIQPHSHPSIHSNIQPFNHLVLAILTYPLKPLEWLFIKVKFLICLSSTMHHFLYSRTCHRPYAHSCHLFVGVFCRFTTILPMHISAELPYRLQFAFLALFSSLFFLPSFFPLSYLHPSRVL